MLDIPLASEGTREAGTTPGSGVVTAVDDGVAEHRRDLGRRTRFRRRIAVEHDAPLTGSACVYCGNRIEVCPTGTLSCTSEFGMRAAGTCNESRQTETTTVCVLPSGLQPDAARAGQ